MKSNENNLIHLEEFFEKLINFSIQNEFEILEKWKELRRNGT